MASDFAKTIDERIKEAREREKSEIDPTEAKKIRAELDELYRDKHALKTLGDREITVSQDLKDRVMCTVYNLERWLSRSSKSDRRKGAKIVAEEGKKLYEVVKDSGKISRPMYNVKHFHA